MHNSCNALESSRNHSHPLSRSVEKLSSMKLVPVPKRLGTAALYKPAWCIRPSALVSVRPPRLAEYADAELAREPRADCKLIRLEQAISEISSKSHFPGL